MTRARGYALAVLFGVCCLGQVPAFAQYGPTGPGPNAPGGYSVFPNGAPDQAVPETWYGDEEEVEASINRVGPRVTVAGRTLRVEYLNWNIGNPGNVLLGAPVAGIADPTKPFPIFAPGTTTAIAFGNVPSTESLNLTNASGVQVMTGWDGINGGRLEVSAFMLGRRQSGFTLPLGSVADLGSLNLVQPGGGPFPLGTIVPTVAATSTLANGQIADHLFLYNQSFTATYTSQLWGGEANYLFGDAVDTFQFLPLVGARYLNLTETLTQTGVFQDPFVATPPLSSQIGSHTINNIWGGQVGFRAQVVTKWLEFGVTPKLLLLGDTAYSSVYAARFRSAGDPTVFNDDLTTKFSFGADVGAFVTVNVAPNFSVRGGYNLLWINQVTRPNRDIVYNDNGTASPAGIGQQTIFHDIFINGFTFGAEFRF